MKAIIKNFSALLFCLTAAVTFAQDNVLTTEEKDAGWTLLFDGKDMGQWRNYQQQALSPLWLIEDGAMKLSAKGGGDIMTRKAFGNFELSLQWKISTAGNSGIFILVDELGKAIYSHAPEVQILDNELHSDNKIDSHLSGSLYDLMAAPSAAQIPANKWNTVSIRLKDKHLTVSQNGVQTVAIVIGSSSWNTLVANSKFANWQGFGVGEGGHIGLQDHGDVVWFKNIKIREL